MPGENTKDCRVQDQGQNHQRKMFSNLLRLKTITYAKEVSPPDSDKKLKQSVFRRQFNSLRNRRLEELEKDAVNDKMNPSTQLRFLKELNRNNPHDVVKIVESGGNASGR